MGKSIVVLRHEYQQALCELTNKAGLPAFVAYEVVRSLCDELKRLSDAELQHELAQQKNTEESETNADNDI